MNNNELNRFIEAQQSCLENVIREIESRKKTTHWMWFVFPQIAGLGHSEMAQKYAIRNEEEAVAFLAHPVLGKRLIHLTRLLVDDRQAQSAEEIFGPVDARKFGSCLTMFGAIVDRHPMQFNQDDYLCFRMGTQKFFKSKRDQTTLDILGIENSTI